MPYNAGGLRSHSGQFPTLKPSTRASSGFEEVAAQELFRVVLFLVFYGEIWALGQIPYVGACAELVFACILYISLHCERGKALG